MIFPKKFGGLGIKDFTQFRIATQCKHILELLHHKHTIWADLVTAKYDSPNPWNISWSRHTSWSWRGFLLVLNALKVDLVKCIGNGQSNYPWRLDL